MSLIFFITDSVKSSIPWYLDGIKWLLAALLGSLIGASISHFFTRLRDKKIDSKKEMDSLTSISNIAGFYLALQQSELTKIEMNIKDRQASIEKLNRGENSRDNFIMVVQDFNLCKSISIEISKIAEMILGAVNEDKKDIVGVIQEIFISNEWYFKTITMLEKYHEAKLGITRDDNYTSNLLFYINSNLAEWLAQISVTKSYSKKTLESFRNKMRDYFGIKINVTTGEVIKLS